MMDSRSVVKTANPRRRKATRIIRPGEIDQSQQVLSHRLGSYERFFASLLRSQATDFLDNKKLLQIICQRLQLAVLTTKILRSYPDVQQHFSSRATLVMEEARHLIAQGLLQWKREIKNRNPPRNGNNSINNHMRVTLQDITFEETTGHSIFTVSRQPTSFTKDELSWLRPGTVVACVKMELADTISNVTLGCILPLNREDMISSKSFTVMVFQKVGKSSSTCKWEVTPIASLLLEHRKFQACMENIQTPVPFYRALLGQLPKTDDDDQVQVIETKPGPHSTPRESDDYSRTSSGDSTSSSDDSTSSSDDSTSTSSGETGATRVDDNTVKSKSQLPTFRLPRLNEMQERAASCFLNADPNTITLIQGPPGTGKTLLIVAILARLLREKQNNDSPRKIMVCCPTNKAISVLCTRFLDCLQDNDHCSFPFSVLLVGDDSKLLDDDVSRSKMSSSSSSKLRSIFLYTWIDTLLQDYSKIQNSLAGKGKKRETPESLFELAELARKLQQRLKTNLPSLPQGVLDTASKISAYLQRLVNFKSSSSHSEILVTVSSLLATIHDWKRGAIYNQLVSNARVIFCTLASAGAAVLKKSAFVADDLIVDEAAAATEPELSIPFGFHPRRMLAVGDPKQLPAMVGSQRAAQLGLGQSLHERLMYDCEYPHIMLNVQYRMRPELSQFPGQHFYEGKIVNGPNVTSPGYIAAANVLNGKVYSFLQVTGMERQAISGSFENEAEAQAVVTLVQELRSASSSHHHNGGRWNSADRIRIITFYQAQVTLLKRMLQQERLGDIVVATVDSSQGCEADVVIISFVRSMGSAYTSGRTSVGFLSDDRRMNVALTRAKYQLVGVGNFDSMASMKEHATVHRLAGDAIGRGCVLKWPFQKDDKNHRNRGNFNGFNSRSMGRDSHKRPSNASSGKGKEHAKRPRASS